MFAFEDSTDDVVRFSKWAYCKRVLLATAPGRTYDYYHGSCEEEASLPGPCKQRKSSLSKGLATLTCSILRLLQDIDRALEIY